MNVVGFYTAYSQSTSFHGPLQMRINIRFWGGRAGQVRDRHVGWWGRYAGHGRGFSRWRWHAPSGRFIPWSNNTLISSFLVLIRRARIFIIRTDKCEVLVGLLRSRRSLTRCDGVVFGRRRRRSYGRRRAGRPPALRGAFH